MAGVKAFRRKSWVTLWLLAPAFSIGAGCSGGPQRVLPPAIDPAAAADKAIEELDKDGDGQLQEAELAAAPGLASAKVRYDADKNGSLSAEEIAGGLRRWAEGKLGAVSVPYVVQLDGRALEGAEVKLTPEPFLGDAAKGAVSETRRGSSYLALAPEDRPPGAPNIPLIQPGLYRVAITHPTRTIPAKYNTASTLGVEIAQETLGTSGITWSLTSK